MRHKMNIKPWRDLIKPHQNVLEGTFQESEFAADLNKVVMGSAPSEYLDPSIFFERTFITEGMKLMLSSVIKRLTGKGGDPVVQLQTAFGGGKTHAMIAVYHIAKGDKPTSQLPGIPPLLDLLNISELPRAHVAVLDGNSLSPSQPRKKGSITVNTLWGEMAWQIGGEEGYRLLEKADQEGTSPGKEILADIFQRFSPSIVLMDETVAYIRQFVEGKAYAGGTYGSNMAFLQALTEASGHVPTAMVLASLPESDIEAGGERGKQALRQIEHLFHRLEAIWKPVSSEEGFEIVRRRVFSKLSDPEARDAVCKTFADMYIKGGNYPSETMESNYLERMKSAYPFHPEIFDRLYEDWASLENFQRTRGVLRLMAMVVHRLWMDDNKDYLIMPGSIPIHDNQVKSELIRYLPTGWEPVLDRDVDGPKSMPTTLDKNDTRFGRIHAARRVSRSIFLGSAPTTSGQKIRGINAEHIRLGCTQPEQSSGTFDDALSRLNDQLYYLYSGNDRYWYDTQTNLRREAEDRMSRFDPKEEHLFPEIAKRLKANLKGHPFSSIHVFTPHSDIPDDMHIRLVVLPPTEHHYYKRKITMATKTAGEIIQKRGQQPRLNQNRLIFLCADEDATSTVYDNTRRYLAWKSILDDKDALNLDQHRIKEATKNCHDYNQRLNGVIHQAYKWVIAPNQDAEPKGGVGNLYWEEQKVTTTDTNIINAITHVLAENEMLIPRWSPIHLTNELHRWYLKADRQDISLKNLWEDFCRYPYMPRLVDFKVLQDTVSSGIESTDFFGYASGKKESRYIGLIFGKTGSVFYDEKSLIVHKDAAHRQIEAENNQSDQKDQKNNVFPTDNGSNSMGAAEPGTKNPMTHPTEPEPQKKSKRFYGTVTLDPVKASLEFSTITQEVIQHFSSIIGTEVNITLEIEAISAHGFEDEIIRTVQENSRTLGFNHAEFEED